MQTISLLPTNRRRLVLLAVAALASSAVPAAGYGDDSLQPDTAFQIDCSQNARTDFDDQVARYLTDQGFRVVDIGKTQRTQGDDPGRHELAGIDRRDRIVRLVSFPRRPNHLSFSLVSTPPTRHDNGFDSAIESFFSRELICDVSQIVTHENSIDTLANFKAEAERLNAVLQASEGLDASVSKP
jgi:hypothetical protein